MKFVTLPAAMIFAITAQSATFVAQGRGNGQIRKTSASTTAAASSPTLTTTAISPETPTTDSVKNPKLEACLVALLPTGTNIYEASRGFKNWGQFVAAVHVSHNLSIPFADLKARMTTLTPGPTPAGTVQAAPMSLEQAIQSFWGATGTTKAGTRLSPAKIREEVRKAEDAANTDLRLSREAR